MLRKFLTQVKALPASERHVLCLQNSGEAQKHLTPPVWGGCVLTEPGKLLYSCFETESHCMLTVCWVGDSLFMQKIIPRRENLVTGKYYSLWNHLLGFLCSLRFLGGCVPDRRVAGGLSNVPALGELPSCPEGSAGTPEPWPGGSRPCYFSPRPLQRARLPIVSSCWLTPWHEWAHLGNLRRGWQTLSTLCSRHDLDSQEENC